jgi:hypothetical protein
MLVMKMWLWFLVAVMHNRCAPDACYANVGCPGCKVAVVNTLPSGTSIFVNSSNSEDGTCIGGIPDCTQMNDGCLVDVHLIVTPPDDAVWYLRVGPSWVPLFPNTDTLIAVSREMDCGQNAQFTFYKGPSSGSEIAGSIFVCCTDCNHTSVDPPEE